MTTTGQRGAVDLLSGAGPPPAALSGIVLAGLRILAGLMWLVNVVWKVPTDFGGDTGRGLYFWTRLAVDHPVFPPYSWLVEHLVLPNFTPFGWLVFVMESTLAVLLLTGTAVRLAALIGVGQSVAIALSVAAAPKEWPWAYAMMIGIHLVLLFTASGRYAAVDAVRAAAATGNGAPVARRLLGGWGAVLALVGLIALYRTRGDELLAVRGRRVGYQELQFWVGDYTLRGALVLLVVAVLMLAAAVMRARVLGLAAAIIAAAAALSIYVQLGRFDVWLGGVPTTAAVFVCAFVVALAARPLRDSPAPATGVSAGQEPEAQGA